MIYPRGEHASAVINGEIYVFGGIHDHYFGPPYVEKYDPTSDTWTDLGEWKNPRHHITAGESVWNNEVWLCGGKWGGDNTSTNQVDIYNAKTNTWRLGPPLPEKHWGGPAVIVGHYLHVLSGAVDKETTSSHHFVLDLENVSKGWKSLNPVPNPVVHAAGVELEGKIFLIGGEYHHKHDGDVTTVQVYDPKTDTWDLNKAQLPIARSHLEWSTFTYDDKIISVCGVDSKNGKERGQNEILVYYPESDEWKQSGSLPYDMTSPGAKAIGETLYVYGGGYDDWFPVNGNTFASEITFESTKTTILKAEISPSTLPAGKASKITYNWGAVPMGKDFKVWVHVTDSNGKTVFTDDHFPPFPTKTSTWSGDQNYTRLLKTPDTLKDGAYKIVAGLFDKGAGRQQLLPGDGVIPRDNFGYVIGNFVIDSNAPLPTLDSDKPKTLNLDGYQITFREEFDKPLDVSASGPGTKWIAHTPYDGDFGDSEFADPRKDFPFKVSNGILSIAASKDSSGNWESGLLCSVDTKGNGFAQQYGYFEMKAKFPKGPGTWPAFWLLALQKLKDRTKMGFEVDIVEQYGREPSIIHSVLHWWYPDKTHKGIGDQFVVEEMYKDFHTYGFMWDENEMIWYFDGAVLWKQPTPEEGKTPMYVLLNLALGPGWPIDKTPNPSYMLVDYVRVYKKK